MKTITKQELKSMNACLEGYKWYLENFPAKKNNPIKVLELLINSKKYDWANWLVVRCLTHEQQIRYAIFAAEQVIEIYEKKYPKDKRPRIAIEAAREYIKTPSEENSNAAVYAAANAAYAANAANAAAAYAAANAYARDEVLSLMAKIAVDAYREIGAPGIKLLDKIKVA